MTPLRGPLRVRELVVRALPAHGQTAAMADTAVAADVHEALDVHRDLAPQVALDLQLALDDVANARGLLVAPRLHPLGGSTLALVRMCVAMDRPMP
jgi:hypothetical protein